MKNSPSINDIGVVISRFLRRYHIVIFSLTMVIGVSISIFFLNELINISNEGEASTITLPSFDQATIDQIDKFSTSDSTQEGLNLPAGRINPFVE